MQFTHSDALTIGMELEFQIVDIQTGQLSPSSLQLRNALEGHTNAKRYALEATLSTMELNSSVHTDINALRDEVVQLTRTLREIGEPLGLDCLLYTSPSPRD